jgi:hypothetical protein
MPEPLVLCRVLEARCGPWPDCPCGSNGVDPWPSASGMPDPKDTLYDERHGDPRTAWRRRPAGGETDA